jgi:hypothetical protein
MTTSNRVYVTRDPATVGPVGQEVDQELSALAAACATVADPSSGATAATVLLKTSPIGSPLTRIPLAQLEQRYDVRITVLDEGSPTVQPCVRITQSTPVPYGNSDERGRSDWGIWAWVRCCLRWRGSREELEQTDTSGACAGRADLPVSDGLPVLCPAAPRALLTAARSARGGCAGTAARTNDDDDARR